MAKATVAVRFVGDVANLKKSLNDVDGAAGKMSKTLKAGLAVGATAVTAFGVSSVKAFVDAEESQKQLADAFDRFPKLADSSQEALQKLNSELQKKTQYDDDAIASGQAVIAQFGLTGQQLEDVTPLLLDYASRTGKDVPSAAQDLGKAMLGNAKALKNIGIKYKSTGDAAQDFTNIQALMTEKVGGFAEKEGTTAAGKAKILANQFGELQEKVGGALVPTLSKLADILIADVLPVIEKVGAWFADHKPVLIGAAAAIGVLAAAWGTMAIATGIHTAAMAAWTIATGIATAAQWAFNAAMLVNPIGLIVVAIAGFVAALVLAYQKVGWFRDFVDASFRLIRSVIETVFNWVRDNWKLLLAILTGPIGIAVKIIVDHWNTIRNAAMAVFNWVRDNWPLLLAILTGPIGLAVLAISRHWSTLKSGVSSVYNWFREVFNKIVDFLSGIPGRIRAIVDRVLAQIDRMLGPIDEVLGKIGSLGGSALSAIPGFATGVRNFRGGLAVVGEDGPELVNLPRGSDVIPNGKFGAPTVRAQPAAQGGMVVNLNVQIPPTMDAGAAGQAITEALAAYVRRNGANDLRLLLGV